MRSDKAYFYFKVSLVGSIVLLSLTFFLVMSLFQHGNELGVLSQFYTKPAGRSTQQVDAIPFKADDSIQSSRLNWSLIDEMLIRYYIETRFSSIPDKYEMTRRLQKGSLFHLLSSPDTYKTFNNLSEKMGNLSKAVMTVDILNVCRDERDKNSYEVDFDIYTLTDNGDLLPADKKTVGIRLGHNLKRRLFKGNFANPYGAYIQKFDVVPRKN